MTRTGTLTIDATNVSRLDGTNLMKGTLNNGGFSRATIFLEQDRGLNRGETIWVDGEDRVFQGMSVILITDAGRAVPAIIAVGAGAETIMAAASKAVVARATAAGGRKGQTKGAKKSKGNKSGTRGSGGKNSAAKKLSGRKTAKLSSKKSNK
jgi:hypothetical protein